MYMINLYDVSKLSNVEFVPLFLFSSCRFQAIPAGTHYWHSHSALQNSDGLFGAFIIREPKDLDPHIDLYDVDDPEYSIMLNDWRLDMISERFANIYQNDNSLGFSKSMLINGNAIDPCVVTMG